MSTHRHSVIAYLLSVPYLILIATVGFAEVPIQLSNPTTTERLLLADVVGDTNDAVTYLEGVNTDSTYLSPDEFRYANWHRAMPFWGMPRRETDIQTIPTIAVGTFYAGLLYGIHALQKDAWWADERGPFHIQEDWEYAKQIDKLGHFYGGYAMSMMFGDMLLECGFDVNTAAVIGSLMGVSYQTYIEIQDGYAKKWGFSPSDAYSNLAGAAYYTAVHYLPFLQNFSPRWSYIPPSWSGEQDINVRPTNFIDDYNGTTFWLGCNIHNLLPMDYKHYWPEWLILSVGYGIRDYGRVDSQGDHISVTPRFLIGLDYNWQKILPELPSTLNYARYFMNFFRLPGPTLELGPGGTRFRLLFPIQISIGNIGF